MSQTCETTKVMPWSDDQGLFVEINKSDFNENVHKLYETTAPIAPPPAVIDVPVIPAAPDTIPAPDTDLPEPVFVSEEAAALFAELGFTREDGATMEKTGSNGSITVEDVEKYLEVIIEAE